MFVAGDQKQDSKQTHDDNPAPTFLLSHRYLPARDETGVESESTGG